MTYVHHLYPLPPLKRLVPAFNESGRPNKPDLDWKRFRFWPYQDLDGPTKSEQQAQWQAQQKRLDEFIEKERAAAREICKQMTIQEAWAYLQGHIHTNEYDIENMSEANWDIFLHAKDLLDNHIKSL